MSKEQNISGVGYQTAHVLFGSSRIETYREKPKKYLKEQSEVVDIIKKFDIKNVIIGGRWTWYIKGYLPHEITPERVAKSQLVYIKGDKKIYGKEAFELGLEQTISDLRRLGVDNIWIILPFPEQHFDVPTKLAEFPDSMKLVSKEEFFARNKEVLEIFNRYNNVNFIDIGSQLLKFGDGDYYPVVFESTPFYWDDDHLSYSGSVLIKDVFAPFFKSIRDK